MIDLNNSTLRRIKRANTDWWINEKAVVADNGKTYIGYVTDVGEVHLKEMDAKCSRAESRDVCLCHLNCDWSDEHNAPAVCVLKNGRILVAWAGHGRKCHCLYYRITEKPYDLLSFSDTKILPYQGGVTYAQIFENTVLGQLWAFCRVDSVNWEFRYSENEGETWSEARPFLHSDDGGLFYCNVRKQYIKTDEGMSEQFFFALYGHPRISRDHVIRSGIFSCRGKLLKTDGTPGRLDLFQNDGTLLCLEEMDVVWASPEGTTVRLLDVAPTLPLRVAFAPFVLDRDDAPDPTKPVYYSATFREGKWLLSAPICAAGEFLSSGVLDGSQTYLGGMTYYYGVGEMGLHRNSTPATSETNRVFLVRCDGTARLLESYVSRDWGKTYQWEQTLRRIPLEENTKLWRPVVPFHAQDNMPLYWHEGRYESHSGGWHCDAVMWVEYDD